MRKTFLTVLGTALLAVSTVQVASAAGRHDWKAGGMTTREQYRDTNAYYPTPVQRYESDVGRYKDVEAGAPAGR